MERLTRNSYPGILCGIIILILTGLPGSVFPHIRPIMGLDKVAHLCMYAGFAFLCLWGYRKQFISNRIEYRRKAILLAVVISITYGGLTELMQEYLIPTRTGDWVDFLADGLGTLLGATIFYLFYKNKK